MPGFDKSRIVSKDKDELDEFLCSICQEIFVKPVVTKCCGQIYCKECIDEWLSSNDTCPQDRKGLVAADLLDPPKLVLNILSNMKIKCDYEANGCEQTPKIEDLERHVSICEKRPKKMCQNCGFNLSNGQHDCIQVLLQNNLFLNDQCNLFQIELESRDEKIKKMEKQLKSQPQMNIKSLIPSARAKIRNYTIEEPTDMCSKIEQGKLLRVSMAAIIKNDSLEEITKEIYENLKVNETNYWHVLIYPKGCGDSMLGCEKYFRVSFESIVIELFTTAIK